jgi:gluconokinase
VRAAVTDVTGQIIAGTSAQIDVDLTVAEGGRAQIDAIWLREATERAIDVAAGAAHALKLDIAVVAMTTFWHSLVALRPNGTPSTAVLTWADTRSEPDALRMREHFDSDAIHQRTGCMLHPSYLPAKLAWLRRHQPDAFAPGAAFLSFAQYATSVWLGSRATSASMASGSGLLDIARSAWDDELLSALDISPAALGDIARGPELLPPLRAEYALRWPALAGVPWRAPIGDGAASNVGAGCMSQERIAVMVGTSGALRRCERAQPDLPIPKGLWRYRLDRDHVVTGGALSSGGNVYEWLRHTLRFPNPDGAEAELNRRAPGQHGLVVLPFLSGERSPGWVGDATAIISGLRLHTTPLDILQAALEAIACRFALIFDLLHSGSETIVATGGGLLASPAWMRMIADATGATVVASGVEEASLRGAALIALRDAGVVEEASLAVAPLGAAYEPRADRYEQYRAMLAVQQTLYDREVGPEGANLLARQTR